MAIRNMLPEVWRGAGWSPVREMARLQRRMDRIFDELVEPVSGRRELLGGEVEELEFVPPCDVQETESHYLLSFDLPGVSKEEVRIELRDHELIVSGERKREAEHKEGGRITRERSYGSFYRSFALPLAAGAENIQANYENGILQIAILKSEEAKPKMIPVKSEKGGIFTRLLAQPKKGEKAA